MYQIIDKLILYILGAILLLSRTTSTDSVITLLIIFILSGIFECIQGYQLLVPVTILFSVLCQGFPNLMFFLPLITYDLGVRKKYLGFFCNIIAIYYFSELELWQIFIWLMTLGLSIYMSIRTNRLRELHGELLRLRDTSTELNLALSGKNKALIANQENEIHLATLKERNRIAREIHDNVGHMLSRCILQVGALSTIYKEEPLATHLQSINESLNTAMNNIRESVHDLRDESVDLRLAIAEAAKDMRSSYTVNIDYDMTAVIPNPVKYAFLMLVKEALANVIKHSNADRVDITLREHPGFYQLAIEDNGNLSSPTSASSGEGMGLKNMRDRIEGMNGIFRYDDQNGFRIFASVPK